MIREKLEERKLPDVLRHIDGRAVTKESIPERRKELITILEENMYGVFPKKNCNTVWRETGREELECGRVDVIKYDVTAPTPDGEGFVFPIRCFVPKTASAHSPIPALVYISFVTSEHYPANMDGIGNTVIAEVDYNDISPDSGDFEALIGSHFFRNGIREKNSTGKMGLWAYATSCVLDLLVTLDFVNKDKIGVIGHSRLGKTALWAGANDERFSYVISNESGCAGAAIIRGKIGELYPIIYQRFPFWFCENMKGNSKSEEQAWELEFDQHFLLAACAPRRVYVASAENDKWADPDSEFLSCVASSCVWELLGLPGFISEDKLPSDWDRYADGYIAYHHRPGDHSLTFDDWSRYLEYIER